MKIKDLSTLCDIKWRISFFNMVNSDEPVCYRCEGWLYVFNYGYDRLTVYYDTDPARTEFDPNNPYGCDTATSYPDFTKLCFPYKKFKLIRRYE